MDEPLPLDKLVPPWIRERQTELARESLPFWLDRFDVTNWGLIIDMASHVLNAADTKKPIILPSYEKTHELHKIGIDVINFNWELPENFRPFISVLLENYGTEQASEGEKFVQYAVEEAMEKARSTDHWVHLYLFFGK